MNTIVITIGTALVLALMTALLAPMFIDWTAYRTTIEANATRILGIEVSIEGEAEVRILPSPRVRLTDVRLGGAQDPLMVAQQVELDVELTPLLSRQLRVRDLRIGAPVATVGIDRDGALTLPPFEGDGGLGGFFNVENIAVQNVSVDNGTLQLSDRRTGMRHTITDVALSGNARSLRGPFNATGEARIGGMMQALRIGGGALEGETMPLSVRVSPQEADWAIRFEGALLPRIDAPSLRGKLILETPPAVPWSLEGTLIAGIEDLSLVGGTLRYGIGEAAIELGAAATYTLTGNEPVILGLQARQLDLDRIDAILRQAGNVPPRAARETLPTLGRFLA
ncbi:MAG: AsmA family protein, partial [Pseudomonadota bacterium]